MEIFSQCLCIHHWGVLWHKLSPDPLHMEYELERQDVFLHGPPQCWTLVNYISLNSCWQVCEVSSPSSA